MATGAAPGMRWHGGMGGKVAAGSFLDFLAPFFPTQNLRGAVTPTWGQQRAGRSRVLRGHQSPSQSPSIIQTTCCRISHRDRPSVFRLCGPPGLSPRKPLSSAFVAGKQPRLLCKHDECGCAPIKLYLQRLLVGPGGGGLLTTGLDLFLGQWFSPESPDHGAHPQHIRLRRAGTGGKTLHFLTSSRGTI